MAIEINCLRCQTPMEEGFILDLGHGNNMLQPRWCTGQPKPSFWGGEAKYHQFKEGLRVLTHRCPKCGYLESYAPADPQQPNS